MSSGMAQDDMNMVQYKASKTLASKAFYISTKIQKSDSTDPALVNTAKMSIRQVKAGIEDMQPWQQVIATMHQKVLEDLRITFNLHAIADARLRAAQGT